MFTVLTGDPPVHASLKCASRDHILDSLASSYVFFNTPLGFHAVLPPILDVSPWFRYLINLALSSFKSFASDTLSLSTTSDALNSNCFPGDNL